MKIAVTKRLEIGYEEFGDPTGLIQREDPGLIATLLQGQNISHFIRGANPTTLKKCPE
jgi:hypothetical protein